MLCTAIGAVGRCWPGSVLIMAKLWSIADLIDLHAFFQLDDEVRQREGEAALIKRDRLIYLSKIKPQMGQLDSAPIRLLVRKWLTIRRLQYQREPAHEGAPLPGTVWQELSFLCHILVLFCGLFAGAGLAGSLLLYTGAEPINVSVYFGIFVVLQVVMLILQAVLFACRWMRRLDVESSTLYLLVARLFMQALDAGRRWAQRSITGQQGLNLAAIAGSIHQRKELAALLIWPGFMLLQVGGIGYNLGVIAVLLAKVSFSDSAFAWQSSLQFSAEMIAEVVAWVAMPWSWLVPQTVPTLEQIQGSQMVLKDGVAHLASADLLSWWPFLLCSVLVYGLLPRCLLLSLGIIRQRQSLEKLHFASLNIRPLLRRMTAAIVDTQGVPARQGNQGNQPQPAPDVAPPAPVWIAHSDADEATGTAPFWVLIPDEIYDDCSQVTLAAFFRQADKERLRLFRFDGLNVMDAANPGELARALAEQAPCALLILQEAWQPPLKETEQMLRSLRQLLGAQLLITLLLIGRPTAQTILTPADPAQVEVWSQKIQALRDPCLSVQPLVQP